MTIIIKPDPNDPILLAHAAREAQERAEARSAQGHVHNQRRAGATVSSGTLERVLWPGSKKDAPGGKSPDIARVYGSDHGFQTSQLTAYILEGLQGERSETYSEGDFWVARTAGLFHDVARAEPWQKTDPGHGRRSAVIVEDLLRGDSELAHWRSLFDDVCRLIAGHGLRPLDGKGDWTEPTNPVAIALHDAECFEAARLSPGTDDGLVVMQKRLDDVISQWARNKEHQRRWRSTRGWA